MTGISIERSEYACFQCLHSVKAVRTMCTVYSHLVMMLCITNKSVLLSFLRRYSFLLLLLSFIFFCFILFGHVKLNIRQHFLTLTVNVIYLWVSIIL